MATNLYHYSDRDSISIFRPRAPLRHPHAEPLVYAIDEWHSPLYFFPRDCPRIGIWPVESSTSEDRAWYEAQTDKRMLLFVEERHEPDRRGSGLFRYEFDPRDGFIDTGDIGVWISRQEVVPLSMAHLVDLPAEAGKAGVEVVVVNSLIETAKRFFDFDQVQFTTSLHVSMIRTTVIENWPRPVTKPPFNPTAS